MISLLFLLITFTLVFANNDIDPGQIVITNSNDDFVLNTTDLGNYENSHSIACLWFDAYLKSEEQKILAMVEVIETGYPCAKEGSNHMVFQGGYTFGLSNHDTKYLNQMITIRLLMLSGYGEDVRLVLRSDFAQIEFDKILVGDDQNGTREMLFILFPHDEDDFIEGIYLPYLVKKMSQGEYFIPGRIQSQDRKTDLNMTYWIEIINSINYDFPIFDNETYQKYIEN